MSGRRASRKAQRNPARKKLQARGLVLHRLENVSKGVFRQYYKEITDLIGSSPGIYALYDEGDLYGGGTKDVVEPCLRRPEGARDEYRRRGRTF